MTARPQITLNRGSDKLFRSFWPAFAGATTGLDLTGYTVDISEVHPALAGHLTVTVANATGATLADRNSWQLAFDIDWQDDMPDGQIMYFRLRLTSAGRRTTGPRVWVHVK